MAWDYVTLFPLCLWTVMKPSWSSVFIICNWTEGLGVSHFQDLPSSNSLKTSFPSNLQNRGSGTYSTELFRMLM